MSIFCLVVVGSVTLAQSPEAFQYQAVIRDAAGNIIPGLPVYLKISILQDNPAGPSVYSETHNPTTNPFGQVSLEIGNGSTISGDFSVIDWGNHSFYLRTELDLTGGGSYQLMGTSQLLSVPFALYSNTTGNNDDGDWSFNGNMLYYNGGHVGIGDNTPEFGLSLDNDGGIMAVGQYGSGALLSQSGAGSRMFWYPRKSAFRAGAVTNDSWDDPNIGDYSVGLGYDCRAEATHSYAMGRDARADAFHSMVLGYHSSAFGSNSIAIGKWVSTNATNSITMGTGADNSSFLTNTVENSLAVGFNTQTPTLFVGGPAQRVGIGTTTPQYGLHLFEADSNAFITVESAGNLLNGSAYFIAKGYPECGIVMSNNGIENAMITDLAGRMAFRMENIVRLNITSDELIIPDGSDVTTTGGGYLVLGDHYNRNIGIDDNEIMTRHNGNTATLYLNRDGGNVVINENAGNVGIGITNPASRLSVNGTVTATAFSGDGSGLTGILGDNLGNHTAAQNLKMNGFWLSGDGGNEGLFIQGDGKVGAGTPTPEVTLHVGAGSDVSLTGGGYIIAGTTDFRNIVIDDNEIMSRNNSGTSPLYINRDGGNVVFNEYAGNVGVGEGNPTEKLCVKGNIQLTGNIIYSNPKTGYVSVAASAFRPNNGNYDSKRYSNEGYGVKPTCPGGELDFTAPVNLPHGAVVKKVTYYWSDGDQLNSTLKLYRNNHDLTKSEMASVSSSGQGGNGSSADATIGYATIDNSTCSYYLSLYSPCQVVSLGVVIEYTYTQP